MTQWQGHSTIRRSMQSDELTDDVWPPPMPRSVRRYTPIEERELTAPPQPVFVVDQRRRSGVNRHSPFPSSSSQPVRRPVAVAQRRQDYAPQPRPSLGQTRDDPQYQQQRRRHQAVPMQDDAWDHNHENTPRRREGQGPRHRPRWGHWLVYLGLGMLAMLALWYLVLTLISWWRVSQDDLHYGRPRTYQTDAVVGHNDSTDRPSHFLALNLNRQVEIIEFPGGDPTKAKIYLGPPLVGPGQDLVPVTLTFRDVNGDGKPDMLVDIEGSKVVFINDGGQFRPLRAGEHVHL